MTTRLERGVATRRPRLTISVGVLVGPFVVLFLVVYLLPLCYSLARSLFRKQTSGLGIGPSRDVFVGLANYVEVVTAPVFWEGILRVFGYALIQIPVMLVFSMTIALLIDSSSARARGFFRLSSFLPYAVPGIVASLLWAYLYVPQLSPVVELLRSWNVTIDLLGAPVVLFSIANIAVWSWAGYSVIIYIASLQSIPREIIEAAEIDGANGWVLATRIKAPLIRGPIVLTALLSTIGSIQLFNEPMILGTVTTAISADWTPMMLAYNATFASNNFEYGSAVSVVIAIIAGVLALAYRRLSMRGGAF